MRRFVLTLLVLLLATSAHCSTAFAIAQYHKAFVKVYGPPKSDDESESDAKAETVAVAELDAQSELLLLLTDRKHRKYRCLICHQGKKKKICNAYGEHFRPLLDRKKDAKDTEKIIAALRTVEQLHSDPDDPSSPTYGELIATGKLPGGNLDDLKKEPAEQEASETESNESPSSATEPATNNEPQ